jgi:hypothetical protein
MMKLQGVQRRIGGCDKNDLPMNCAAIECRSIADWSIKPPGAVEKDTVEASMATLQTGGGKLLELANELWRDLEQRSFRWEAPRHSHS